MVDILGINLENNPLLCIFASAMIRKTILLCMLLMGMVAYAQPRFAADADIIKTGEVLFQKPHTIVFGFTNKGTKPLHIKKVHPSCGCAKVTFTRGNIAPKERGEIVVVYDAATLGTFSKYIEVFTNEEKEPEFLVFQGRVVTELSDYTVGFPIDLGNIRMNTNYIEFDNVKKGELLATELKIVNTERVSYRPQLMHLPPYLRAEYLPENIPGGKTGVIRLILDTNSLTSMGLNQTNVYLARYQGDKIGDSNEIVVSSVLLPSPEDISASKGKIKLSSEEVVVDKKAKKMQAEVTITNEGTSLLTIHNLQVFNHAVEASLSDRTLLPGKSAKLKMVLKKKWLKRFKARPRVLIVSDDAENPVKTISIFVKD